MHSMGYYSAILKYLFCKNMNKCHMYWQVKEASQNLCTILTHSYDILEKVKM